MTKFREFPIKGKFGKYGGKYIPETLVPAIIESFALKVIKNIKLDNTVTTNRKKVKL